MDSQKVTVETKTAPAAPVVVARKEGRWQFAKTLAAVYLSRKFMVTMTLFWMVYGVYWAAVQCIYSFESEAQLRAFTTIFQTSMGTLGAIALGYLGFSRTSSSLSSYVSSVTSSQSPINRNWKSDPDDR